MRRCIGGYHADVSDWVNVNDDNQGTTRKREEIRLLLFWVVLCCCGAVVVVVGADGSCIYIHRCILRLLMSQRLAVWQCGSMA